MHETKCGRDSGAKLDWLLICPMEPRSLRGWNDEPLLDGRPQRLGHRIHGFVEYACKKAQLESISDASRGSNRFLCVHWQCRHDLEQQVDHVRRDLDRFDAGLIPEPAGLIRRERQDSFPMEVSKQLA